LNKFVAVVAAHFSLALLKARLSTISMFSKIYLKMLSFLQNFDNLFFKILAIFSKWCPFFKKSISFAH